MEGRRTGKSKPTKGGITFAVRNDVKVGQPALSSTKHRWSDKSPATTLKEAVEKQSGGQALYVSPCPDSVVCYFDKNNVFARAVHMSFYDHVPLSISPDAVWQTILSGLAIHISENAEILRHKFVRHEGKEKVVLVKSEFDSRVPDAPWHTIVESFTEALGKKVGDDKVHFAEGKFSTSTPVTNLCNDVALMDCMSSYYEYFVVCGCGIPSITLRGTREDWLSIRQRTEKLRDYELGWWVDELGPVLDQFVEAFSGQVDLGFWESACSLYGGSGFCRPITGWVQAFFPYLTKGVCNDWGGAGSTETGGYEKNTCLGLWRSSAGLSRADLDASGCMMRSSRGDGVELQNIPSGVSFVDFVCADLRVPEAAQMKFVGGLTCIAQDQKTKEISAEFGWGVVASSRQTLLN
jgi:hypothetical protein